jgi:hypothetical protein
MMYSGPASTALILRSLHGGATVGATDDDLTAVERAVMRDRARP